MSHNPDGTASFCEDITTKYYPGGGNVIGTATFSFPFEYMDEDDVHAALWQDITKDTPEPLGYKDAVLWKDLNADAPSKEVNGVKVYYDMYFTFVNPTEIKYVQRVDTGEGTFGPQDYNPPAVSLEPGIGDILTVPPRVKIYRLTDIDPLIAMFYPGSSIRAQDLNDNFEQLKLAIEEGRCLVEDLDKEVQDFYWNKLGDTTYSNDDWEDEANDLHVPTTGAVQNRLELKVDKEAIVNQTQQEGSQWINSRYDTNRDSQNNTDDQIPSTAAASERWDNYMQDARPGTQGYRIPGKTWIDTDDLARWVWDPQNETWVLVAREGPVGPRGPEGTASTIVSDTPPINRNETNAAGNPVPIEDGDFWFDTTTGRVFIAYTDPDCNTGRQWVAPFAGGPQGPQGEAGEDGQDGQDGQDGAAATIEVGTTTTGAPGTNAAVSNSGTTSAAVFDFVIPRGDQGLQGEAGQDGEDGEDGAPGNQGSIGDNPPANPDVGDLWFCTDCPSGQYIWDGNQWVGTSIPGPAGPAGGVTSIIAGTNITIDPAAGTGAVTINSTATGGGGGGIPEAPNDGELYGRQSQAWAAINIPNPGIPEAPNDGQQYARQSQAWSVVAPPTNFNFIAPLQQTGDNVSFVWNSINALP